jgi:hypothetical protein
MRETQDVVVRSLESGLDWLSLTAGTGTDAGIALASWCDAAMVAESANGGKMIETAPQGYHGTRCGHIFYGVGRFGYLFQIGGAVSNEALKICKELPNEFRCTRADYQVTTPISESHNDYAGRLREIVRGTEHREGTAEGAALTLYENFRIGCGITCGSRVSGSYLRIYNKGAESKQRQLKGHWRYELETKRELSKRSWAQLLATDDVPILCRSVVARKMSSYGIPVPFSVPDNSLRLATQERSSSDQRRADWFINQVLPTIDKISDNKLRAEVRSAFSLRFNMR